MTNDFPNIIPTRHVGRRLQQRGRTWADLDMIVCYGTEIRPDLYVLRNRDVDELIGQHKHLTHMADRLRGWVAIVCEGSVLTCYFPSGAAGRRAIRGVGYRHKRLPTRYIRPVDSPTSMGKMIVGSCFTRRKTTVDILEVLEHLSEGQIKALGRKAGLAGRGDRRPPSLDRLSRYYNDDWVRLLKHMTKTMLVRALSEYLKDLDTDELRVVALREFDRSQTDLDRINWRPDGNAPQKRRAGEIIKDLYGVAGPQRLQANTWENQIAPRLRERGIEADRTATGNADRILLSRIFR